MDITYFALKPINVDGEYREPGDLIPEARDWATLTGYIQDGRIHPVLVATLPKATRDALAQWEEEQDGVFEADTTTATPAQTDTRLIIANAKEPSRIGTSVENAEQASPFDTLVPAADYIPQGVAGTSHTAYIDNAVQVPGTPVSLAKADVPTDDKSDTPVIAVVDEDPEDEENEDDEDDEEIIDVVEAPVKRRPGRPRKIVVPEETPVQGDNGQDQADNTSATNEKVSA